MSLSRPGIVLKKTSLTFMTLKSHSIQRVYVFTSNTLAVIRLSFTSRIVLKKRAILAHIARFLTIEKASNTLKSINNIHLLRLDTFPDLC